MNIYKVSNEYQNLIDKDIGIIEHVDNFKHKAINICAYIKNLEKDINAIKEYELEMKEKRKRHEKKIEDLKKYIKESMQALEIDKIKSLEFNISCYKNGKSVDIINENEINAEFFKVVTTKSVDKSKILKHFEETGELVSGVSVTDTISIRIK